MRAISRLLAELRADRRGLSSTELGIVLALIALGSVQALSLLGKEVEEDLDTTKAEVAKNRANADPFARGPQGIDSSENRSNDGSDGSEPASPSADPGTNVTSDPYSGDEPASIQSKTAPDE